MQTDLLIPQLIINNQYVKDLSFENPGAPAALLSNQIQPEVALNVNVSAQHLQEDFFEIILHLDIKAENENETLFLIDLQYAGLFTVSGFPKEEIEEILLIACPEILFPFARQVICNCTQNGGLSPLLLDLINFRKLFEDHKSSVIQRENELSPDMINS